MEFLDDNTGKLYHHKMKCIQLTENDNVESMLAYLRKRHQKYLTEVEDI